MMDAAPIQDARDRQETFELMRSKLARVLPEFEISLKANLAFEINQLKRELNAVILGHNYMEPALFHSVPDHAGDSLALSRISAQTDADIIVFCGVLFMAETAKILNPNKTVLIPSLDAGCSLAEGISVDDIRALRERFPGAPVVTYVNTYADVKAESDYCCTSGNATAVVRHLFDQGRDQVLFLPDEFLARNTATELGVPFLAGWEPPDGPTPSGPTVIGWKARCEVHELYTVEDIERAREQFPEVTVLAHPECSPEVIERVDFAGSTKQMLEYVDAHDVNPFLLLTECSMGDNIAAENPSKEMLRLCSQRCPYMALITLEDTLEALRKIQYKVELPSDIIERARVPIDRMLEIS